MKNVYALILLSGLASFIAGAAGAQSPPSALSYVQTRDVFVGGDKTGPYPLAWKNVRTEGVTVVVDGAALTPDSFTLDAAAGTVTFKTPLKTKSVARIDYAYEPARAARNPDPAVKPVTISLLSASGARGSAGVHVTALPGEAAGSNGGPLLVWGLNGKTNLLGGGVSSQVLLSPGGAGGSFADRAGLRLGYSVAAEKLKLDASFVRAGGDFAAAAGKSFGLADPSQRWSLAGQTTPAGWLAADFRLGGARDLSGKGATDGSAFGLRLGGTKRLPLLNLARTEDTRHTTEGAATSVTTESANFTGTIGLTTVTARGARVTTDGTDAKADQTKQDASVALSAASRDKKAQASVAVSGGMIETAQGVETRQGVEVKLQPAPLLTLSAEARLQAMVPTEPGKDAKRTVYQAASAELKPFNGTSVTGSLRLQGEGDAQTVVTAVDARTQPFRYLLLSGGLTDREDSRADALDTRRVGLSLRPLGGITLTGGLIINPEDKGAVLEAMRQEYKLAARVGALDLGGGYSVTTLAAAAAPGGLGSQSGELSVNLGLRFSRYTRLTSGYKDAFLWGGPESRGIRMLSLGLTHNLGSAFNFSLAGSRTEDKAQIGRPADMKADVKLGLKF